MGKAFGRIGLAIAILTTLPGASLARERNAFETTKNQFEELRADLFSENDELKRRYSEELKKLRDKAVDTGNLDLTVEIEEASKALAGGFRGTVSTNADLKRIQSIFFSESERLRNERERKLRELVLGYLRKLESIERDLTRGEKIDEALAVRAELETMKKLSDALGASYEEILVSRKWVRHDIKIREKRTFIFGKEGSISAEGARTSWTKWEIVDSKIAMHLKNGTRFEFTIRREELPVVIEEIRSGRNEFYFVEVVQ